MTISSDNFVVCSCPKIKNILLFNFHRYKEAPSKEDDDVLDKHFGIRWNELQDGFVADDSIDAIKTEFGNDAKFTPSNFHNKSENEKILKDRQQQDLGLFI